MTPLLNALVAAAKVGFDAPRCQFCSGYGVDPETGHDPYPCSACHATGLDAGDPERLIGRVFVYAGWNALREEVICGKQCYTTRVRGEALAEPHDRTLESRATALLRLVARVGGAS